MDDFCDKKCSENSVYFWHWNWKWRPLFSHSSSAHRWAIPVIKNDPIRAIFEIEIESGDVYFHIPIQHMNGPFLWSKKLRKFCRLFELKMRVVATFFTFVFSPWMGHSYDQKSSENSVHFFQWKKSGGLYFYTSIQPINGSFLWSKVIRNFCRFLTLKLKVVVCVFTFLSSP